MARVAIVNMWWTTHLHKRLSGSALYLRSIHPLVTSKWCCPCTIIYQNCNFISEIYILSHMRTDSSIARRRLVGIALMWPVIIITKGNTILMIHNPVHTIKTGMEICGLNSSLKSSHPCLRKTFRGDHDSKWCDMFKKRWWTKLKRS